MTGTTLMKTLVLTRGEVDALLPRHDYLPVGEEAFRRHAEGQSLAPGLLHLDAPRGEFHIKAGGLRLDRLYFAVKANAAFFHNPALHGLPSIQGAILLFDGSVGRLLAMMDSGAITVRRTGGATAVAAKYLARTDTHQLAICGCGVQGRVQLAALCQILPVSGARAWDLDPDRARAFADQLAGELGIPVEVAHSAAEAVASADVCVTCTPARSAYVEAQTIRPGTFIAAVGADSAEKQELDPALLAPPCRVVVDSLSQCAAEGELHHALDARLTRLEDVAGELAELVSGRIIGRQFRDQITVFDATGTALQDVAAAAAVYERAVARGVGQAVVLGTQHAQELAL